MSFHKKPLTLALVCWALALLFGGCGAYCGVTDPFFTSEGIGSGISFWAAVLGLGVGFSLVISGLILVRQIALSVALVNLVVFAVAIMYYGEAHQRWGMVFVVVAVSLLLSVPLYLRLAKWRSGEVSRGRG
jgi:hypothetical protein